MRHTEGPWEVYNDIDVRAVNGINRHVCTCSGNARANARLIAAAPELLAALEQVVKWLDRTGESRSAGGMEYGYVKDARAAIDRAKGVSA